MREIEATLFDLDGTIVETGEWVNAAFEESLKANNLPVPSRHEINKLAGLSLRECYKILAPGFSDPEKLFRSHNDFQEKNPHLAVVFGGMFEEVGKLRDSGIKTGVVTSRSKTSALKLIDRLRITDIMDVVVTHEDVQNQKPHPEPILKALTSLKVKPKRAVMIGDTKPDIQAGRSAGVTTIGVTYGFDGQKMHENGADYVVDQVAEIFPTILAIMYALNSET